MAKSFSLNVLSLLFLFFSLSSASVPLNIICEACKASPDRPNCVKWLSRPNLVPPYATILQVIQSALNDTTENLNKSKAMAKQILNESTGNSNRTTAANTCLEMVRYSVYRIQQSALALHNALLKDARAWLSAALAHQYSCWSTLKYVNETESVAKAMEFLNETLIPGTSSTLGMMVNYDVYGSSTMRWGPPKTERNRFWEHVAASGGGGAVWKCGVPVGLKPDVTVCAKGCDYSKVQKAVDGAPENLGLGKRFVIWIKTGVYPEIVRVPLEKKNLVFLGDGMGKTVITGSRMVGQPDVTTYNSPTLAVAGDGFMAKKITIRNTAGPIAHQAVAFRSDSDHSVLQECEFIGHQDTLYASTLRQYYNNCTIQGNVDFIFGNSAAVFEECTILVNPRQDNATKSQQNPVAAHGRTDPGQLTGFVFLRSLINGTAEYMDLFRHNPNTLSAYLARPWKEYSRVVFIECTLESLISSKGFMPWDNTTFALDTLYFAEYENQGPGRETKQRVPWSMEIPPKHVSYYEPKNFIQADC
ncbi:Probable pectinesterase/pectinesterase inhibitor 51 [Striga hermonthica]|uniref:pectinesterase n=1 Tax=Striga hermonthica TaxID=68872 RepID=A0A9N7MMM3_STRHE|nr:Probable pectinesterase/pectinesterase inhibitor 51 [Striga hermonthica]